MDSLIKSPPFDIYERLKVCELSLSRKVFQSKLIKNVVVIELFANAIYMSTSTLAPLVTPISNKKEDMKNI